MSICQNSKCQKEHDGTFATGRFCSRGCANSKHWSEEDKKKKSESAKKSEKIKHRAIRQIGTIYHKKIPRIKTKCLYCGIDFEQRITEKRKYHAECWKQCCGKYNKKSSFHGWYKGYWCDSSWELAWVIYQLEHEIKFERNTQGFEYEFEGKKHKYYPDFILEDGSYVEIKNFSSDNTIAKLKNFPFKIQIFYKKELQEIFAYVIKKYGKNFIELYDGNPYNKKKNICQICGNPCRKHFCSNVCSMTFLGRKKRTLQWKDNIAIAIKKHKLNRSLV